MVEVIKCQDCHDPWLERAEASIISDGNSLVALNRATAEIVRRTHSLSVEGSEKGCPLVAIQRMNRRVVEGIDSPELRTLMRRPFYPPERPLTLGTFHSGSERAKVGRKREKDRLLRECKRG